MPKILSRNRYNKIQSTEFVLERLAAAPASPVQGQKYFDTTLNAERTFNGTSWITLGTGGNASKASGTITGNGSLTSFVVTHGANTRVVNMQVSEAASPFEVVQVDIELTSTTTSTIKFETAPANAVAYDWIAVW